MEVFERSKHDKSIYIQRCLRVQKQGNRVITKRKTKLDLNGYFMKEDILMQKDKKYYILILIPPYIFQ